MVKFLPQVAAYQNPQYFATEEPARKCSVSKIATDTLLELFKGILISTEREEQ